MKVHLVRRNLAGAFLVAFIIYFLQSGSAQTVFVDTFYYTGSTQTFVVPNCASQITVELQGAEGGNGSTSGAWPGGYGGRGTVVVTPMPGAILYVNIGGKGTGTLGGFNGGGNGGKGQLSSGGGGGGASDIRLGGNGLNNRIMVIGGGGGGAGGSASAGHGGQGGTGWLWLGCNSPWGFNGQGGWDSFGPANSGTCTGGVSNTLGGGGGGLTSGGQPATIGTVAYGTAGSLAMGGFGADSAASHGGTQPGVQGAGGGGGGYYGGAGGNSSAVAPGYIYEVAGGGGGGSTYMDSTIVVSFTFGGVGGFHLGNGLITFSYTLNGPAVALAASAHTVCSGSPVSLVASGVNSYTWISQPGFPSSNSASVLVAPHQSTSYTVTGTNSSGCVTSSVISISVSAPPLQISASPSASVCTGGTVALTASGASSYNWSGGIQNGVPFAPQSSGIYTVTGTDQLGCSASRTIMIGVGAQSIPVSGPGPICPGATAILSAGGASFSTYQWDNGSQTSTVAVTPSATTVYSVTGSTPGSTCSGAGTILVVVYPAPAISVSASQTLLCLGDPLVLSAGGAITYTWYAFASTPSVTGGQLVVTPSVSTMYTVTGVAATGCRSSAMIAIPVDACLGFPETPEKNSLRIFPNPSQGGFYVYTTTGSGITMYNLLGMRVSEAKITSAGSGMYFVDGLPSGTYVVQVATAGGQAPRMVIVQ